MNQETQNDEQISHEWMPSNISVTPNIQLEQIRPEHAESLFNLIRENKDHLSQWLGWVNKTHSLEDTTQFIQYAQDQYQNKNIATYVIKDSYHLVGLIDIKNINWDTKSGCFGYWLAQKASGRGVITLCCQTLIQHVINKLQWNQVQIRCAPGNQKSANIAKRLGFTYKETIQNAENINGTWLDHDIYTLDRS